MENAVLEAKKLTIKSATRTVINDVSIIVPKGKIVALLGPNGAGKSELVLGIAGVMPLASGSIVVNQASIEGRSVQDIRAAGVAAVPEGHQVMAGLSVFDNLKAAGPMHTPDVLKQEIDAAFGVFPELRDIQTRLAGTLSGGQQQMVAIAQALVSKPLVLLIDEMSLGLAPVVIDRLIDVIKQLKQRGIGILLIEQFTHLALDVADHCYVLSQGTLHFDGAPDQLKSDPSILEQTYLGAQRH